MDTNNINLRLCKKVLSTLEKKLESEPKNFKLKKQILELKKRIQLCHFIQQ